MSENKTVSRIRSKGLNYRTVVANDNNRNIKEAVREKQLDGVNEGDILRKTKCAVGVAVF